MHILRREEDEVFLVLLGQCRYFHRNARQVNALVLAQHAAVDDLAHHVKAIHFRHAQLDQTV